jgi:hypothetical protein
MRDRQLDAQIMLGFQAMQQQQQRDSKALAGLKDARSHDVTEPDDGEPQPCSYVEEFGSSDALDDCKLIDIALDDCKLIDIQDDEDDCASKSHVGHEDEEGYDEDGIREVWDSTPPKEVRVARSLWRGMRLNDKISWAQTSDEINVWIKLPLGEGPYIVGLTW